MIIILLNFNIIIAGNFFVYANEQETLVQTIGGVRSKNILLQTGLFLHEVQENLKGVGYDDNGLVDIEPEVKSYSKEKLFAIAAFYHRYTISGTTTTYAWAEDELLPTILSNFSKNHKILRKEDDQNISIYHTIENMIALEFLASAYRDSQNIEIKNQLLEPIFNQRESMKANNTPGYYGPIQANHLAFWTAIEGEGNETGINSYHKYTSGGDPNYEYCLTNTSLWAIAGILNYGMLIRESFANNENGQFNASLRDAQKVINYIEDELYINATGFKEKSEASVDVYFFRTQALSLLAYARLYKATGNNFYINRVDDLIENIIKPNFIDAIGGGAVTWINITSKSASNIKEGYGNALYAYSLIELYKATNQEIYLTTAIEIINFLNNYMYKKSSDGKIEGYIEFITKNGTIYDPPGLLSNTTRKWDTNALIFYINEEIYFSSQPWFIKNMVWIIAGSSMVIGVTTIIFLLKKYKTKRIKQSKTVKPSQ